MASSDPDSKPNNSEKEKPKAAAKAKPKGRKPKPKAQEAKAVPEDTAKRDSQAVEEGMNPAAEEKKQNTEKAATELPAKKKGRPKGRKPKAKPAAAEVAAAETEAQSPQQPLEANPAATEKSEKQQGPSQPQAGTGKIAKKRGRPKGPKPKAVPDNEAQAGQQPEEPITTAAQTGESPESPTKPQEEAEKPVKKKGRPKGRKPKAKPQPAPEKPELATPASQEEAAPKAKAAAEGKENVDPAEVAQAETAAKKKSRSKNRRSKAKSKLAKEREQPVQDQEASAPEKAAAAPEAPEENLIAEKAIEYMGPPLPVINLSPLPQGKVRVIIGSQNPAKIRAAELAFTRMFPNESMEYISAEVESGVSDQPMSDDESFAGAIMRAQLCREAGPEASYWVGIEGGLEEIGDELHAFAWMVILGPDKLMGKARTSTFVLPPVVADLIREGKELGEADDIVFERQDSKLDSGAVGILTHGLFDRAQYYADALIMALIPFKNPHLYNLDLLEAAEAEA